MAKRMRDIHVQSLFRFLRKTTKGVSKRDSSEMTLGETTKGTWSADVYAQAIRYHFLVDLHITRYANHSALNQT